MKDTVTQPAQRVSPNISPPPSLCCFQVCPPSEPKVCGSHLSIRGSAEVVPALTRPDARAPHEHTCFTRLLDPPSRSTPFLTWFSLYRASRRVKRATCRDGNFHDNFHDNPPGLRARLRGRAPVHVRGRGFERLRRDQGGAAAQVHQRGSRVDA